jgi:putative permease
MSECPPDTGLRLICTWLRERFADPQVIILVLLLLIGIAIVLLLGEMLAPVIAALVIAYLLEGVVRFLERRKVPRQLSVIVVFTVFMLLLLLGVFILVPLLTQQIGQLLNQLPLMITRGQEELLRLPQHYPQIISEEQVRDMMAMLRVELMGLGQRALTFSLSSVVSVIAFLVYVVLVPLLVFFFLKDKKPIQAWIASYLPGHLDMSIQVWKEVNTQIANYIRGKVWEILIVWSASALAFTVLRLDFAMLLSFFVGLSVLIPYIGATVATIPIAVIAYFQWGVSPEFLRLMVAYGIIQLLDGNVLAPVLLGEVVNLHPVAVIVAILIFGGLWGFWGIFFAIPLATLVHAVLKSLSAVSTLPSSTPP